MPSTCKLLDIVEARATHQPTTKAYAFLDSRGTETAQLDYAGLAAHSRTIANTLIRAIPNHTITSEHAPRVLLLYPPGLDFVTAFYGCLFAGVIAVPVSPPEPYRLQRTLPRLLATLADSGATVILTTGTTRELVDTLPGMLGENDPRLVQRLEYAMNRVIWVCSDVLEYDGGDCHAPLQPFADSVAMLQYTSGSTAAPKGVMLTRGNIDHNLAAIHTVARQDSASCFVSWLPTYHDMGLVGSVLYPMLAGFSSVLMSPATFLKRPLRWLQAIQRHSATITAAPNFAYDLCVTRVDPASKPELDLSSLNLVLTGSEPVRSAVIDRFCRAFEPCGLRREAMLPSYGLAESTCAVSGSERLSGPIIGVFSATALRRHQVQEVAASAAAEPDGDTVELVASGSPLASLQIHIVDPDTRIPCTADRVGEIWVAGGSVSSGYWNQSTAPDNNFDARMRDDNGSSYLRTGDLGFVHRGQLFVSGRLKDLIIINGQNHYPQDIERTAEASHPGLRAECSAAFTIEGADGELLVVVAEIARGLLEHDADANAVRQAIRRQVSNHHALTVNHIELLRPGSISKTSSGKIQRRTCRSEYLAGNDVLNI